MGKASCEILASVGARVAVLDIVASRAETVASGINQSGGSAFPLVADILQPHAPEAAITEAAERLAWNARGLGTWVYHAWLLRPVDGGCWVLTEENQHGWLCRLHKFFLPEDMYKKHQMWLEGLKKEAEAV